VSDDGCLLASTTSGLQHVCGGVFVQPDRTTARDQALVINLAKLSLSVHAIYIVVTLSRHLDSSYHVALRIADPRQNRPVACLCLDALEPWPRTVVAFCFRKCRGTDWRLDGLSLPAMDDGLPAIAAHAQRWLSTGSVITEPDREASRRLALAEMLDFYPIAKTHASDGAYLVVLQIQRVTSLAVGPTVRSVVKLKVSSARWPCSRAMVSETLGTDPRWPETQTTLFLVEPSLSKVSVNGRIARLRGKRITNFLGQFVVPLNRATASGEGWSGWLPLCPRRGLHLDGQITGHIYCRTQIAARIPESCLKTLGSRPTASDLTRFGLMHRISDVANALPSPPRHTSGHTR